MDPEIKAAVDAAVNPVMTAFEAFKAANDERLKEIEEKGAARPETEAKLAKIETELGKYEGINAKVTAAESEAKAAKEEAEALKGENINLKDQVDGIELRLNRTRTGGDPERRESELKEQVNIWARAVYHASTLGVVNLSADQQKSISDAEAEYKALNVGTDTAGGYLAPVEYVREIIKGVTEISPVRSLVRVRSTALKSIQIPKRTGQFAAQWVSEQGTKAETEGLSYGLEELHTHELYALIDMSNQMLEDTAFNMESEIRMESEEQFALAEGAAVVSGNGVGKPEGWLTNSDVGTVNSGAATAVTADGLLTLKHAIKTAYTRDAWFTLNRSTLGSVRKLKDANDQYLWIPGLAQGKPNTIDSDPYVEVPDMPSEGAAAKCVTYGDFRRAYTMVDRIAMEMLRDPYTQATSGNVRFIFRRRLGGQVVLPEAIHTMVCAA